MHALYTVSSYSAELDRNWAEKSPKSILISSLFLVIESMMISSFLIEFLGAVKDVTSHTGFRQTLTS